MPRRRPRRLRARRPTRLTEALILCWADDHRARTGRWPSRTSGHVRAAAGATWVGVDSALKAGSRGLPGGSSLAQLLARRRGVRHKGRLPHYTAAGILAWARAHRRRSGDWPRADSGPIPEAPGETWAAVDSALAHGRRGLPGGSSLARLLAERLGVRNRMGLPPLSAERVLAWADEHRRRTGRWPTRKSGPIPGAAYGESWGAVAAALIAGARGLAGYGSLARLLARRRGARNRKALPPLRVGRILAWADAHYRRTGSWPRHVSGAIAGAPGETWMAVESALKQGNRGLPGGSSLHRLLVERGRKAPPRQP